MAKEGIALEEWLAEVNRLGLVATEDDNAFTVREVVEQTGRGVTWVRQQVRRAIEAGLLEVVWRRCIDMAGRPQRQPAYRLIKKAKGKKA